VLSAASEPPAAAGLSVIRGNPREGEEACLA
jgi:hypothetical protein